MGTDLEESHMMKVAVDAMGGDYAPCEVVKGAVEAAEEFENIGIVLVGQRTVVEEELGRYRTDPRRLSTVWAEEVMRHG